MKLNVLKSFTDNPQWAEYDMLIETTQETNRELLEVYVDNRRKVVIFR